MFEEDQADRQTKEIDWSLVSRRDAERQQRVLELLDAGAAKVSEDYFHAAMVFQHGDTIAHITRAHDLALKAVALDPEHLLARWLVAATEDRGLMYLKKPQKYGTQYQGPAPWVLYEVDPSTTDAEREEWNVPSLEEARSLLLRMNANGLPTPAK